MVGRYCLRIPTRPLILNQPWLPKLLRPTSKPEVHRILKLRLILKLPWAECLGEWADCGVWWRAGIAPPVQRPPTQA